MIRQRLLQHSDGVAAEEPEACAGCADPLPLDTRLDVAYLEPRLRGVEVQHHIRIAIPRPLIPLVGMFPMPRAVNLRGAARCST
jgi:hypothetical protein